MDKNEEGGDRKQCTNFSQENTRNPVTDIKIQCKPFNTLWHVFLWDCDTLDMGYRNATISLSAIAPSPTGFPPHYWDFIKIIRKGPKYFELFRRKA